MRKDLPQTPEEMLAHFSRGLTPKEIETIRENLFCESEYAFVEDREYKDFAWCSHCRQFVKIGKHQHHDVISCPSCHETLMVVHPWRSIKHVDTGLIYLFRRSVLDERIVTGMAVAVLRSWLGNAKDGNLPHELTEYMTVDTYYLWKPGAGGIALSIGGSTKAWYGQDYHLCPVGSRDGVYAGSPMGNFPFYKPTGALDAKSPRGLPCNWHGGKIYADTESLDEAMAKSPIRYAVDAYIPSWEDGSVARLLDLAARWPSAELVIKMGCRCLIEDKICKRYPTLGVINWRGKTLDKIFKGHLTKTDKAYMADWPVTEGGLKLWQEAHGTLSMEAETMTRCASAAASAAKLIDVGAAYKWLKKHNNLADAGLYFDYIRDCAKLGLDLKDKSVLHPKDIGRAHINTIRQIQYKRNELLEKAYQRRRRELERKYSFEADGFAVVVPESTADYIAEGKAMHNCVGGYIDNVAHGKTDVVFIRRMDAPDKSYITMEINQGRIIQARAHHNTKPDDEGLAFVELFRQEVLEGHDERHSRIECHTA